MAGGKETPRQKMIGMMYLVLTALLAMNISKDVLQAFIQIQKGLGKTNSILEEKSQRTIEGINASTEGAKAVPFQKVVADVDKWADEMINYIEEMKGHVMASSSKANETGEGWEEFMKDEGGRRVAILPDELNADGKLIISKPDENQNNTSLLIGHDENNPHNVPFSAVDLKGKLMKFKEQLMAIRVERADSGAAAFTLPEDLQASIKETFNYEEKYKDKDGKELSWESTNFFHMPLVAVLANLTKLETDVMNIKNNVCMALAAGINATDMKFNDVTVAVVPKQSYIIRGGEFEAEIYLAAYNKSSKNKIYMAGETDPKATPVAFEVGGRAAEAESDGEGKCHFKVSTGGLSVGPHAYKGQIEYMKNGKPEYIPFIVPAFYVGEPVAVVNAVKNNVLYKGLDNPIEVSVPGANGEVVASCQGCSLTKTGNGTYTAKPDASQKEATITVTANINGENKNMGSKTFRLKKVPDPFIEWAGKKAIDTKVTKGDAAGGMKLYAKMDPEFIFDGVKYNIKKYKLGLLSGNNYVEKDGVGDGLSSEMKTAIANAKAGTMISFFNIIVQGPDGREVPVPGLNLKMQ